MLIGRNLFTVKGNKIRVRCSVCKTIRYHAVSPNLRRKLARCKCGKSMQCMLEYRKRRRDLSVARAEVTLNSRVFRGQVSDISLVGVGFTVKGLTRPFRVGQDAIIQFKIFGGKNSVRKIRIMNVSPSRIGARFTDIALSLL